MAGDWIKFEISTPDKPEVWQMAEELKIDPDAVVGKLLRVWSWFDQQSEKGNAPTVTKLLLNRLVGVTGFCESMISCGWLTEENGKIFVTSFEKHNGKSAKTRANTAKRVSNFKNKTEKNNAKSNADNVTQALPKEEKRREDISTTTVVETTQQKKRAARLPDDWKPTKDYWEAAETIKPDITQEWFIQVAHKFKDYWIAKSGKDATKADWLATWRNWIRREAENAKTGIGTASKQSYGQQRSELFDAVTDYKRATNF